MASVDNEIARHLVSRAREGDSKAFSQLVRLMMNDIVALTYRMTQDGDAARDLAQEAFVAAWQALPDFREEAGFKNWLYRIATNRTLNFLKQRQRRQTEPIETLSRAAPVADDVASNPEKQLMLKEMRSQVLAFMAGLPDQQRLVFDLRFYKDLSFEEIADVTGRALGTVKTHYRQAVIKLREFAQQQGWR